MNIKLGPPKLTDLKPRITVIGVGGAGCNAVNNMIATQLDGVEFIAANTDAQSLSMSNAERRLQLGSNLTEGLGAGARPEVGEAAAREAEEDIRAEIAGSHMVFLAAGMGGGTGTGAATVIAEIARDLGILTVGIVSKPFQFEGARRMRTAEAGVATLEKVVDTLIVIPNQNLFRIANERTTFAEAFRLADQVLYSGIACIVDLIVKEGLINLDFADVQAVMKGMGTAMMGTGEASGEDRALTAANEAIANPLLDNITLSGAQGLLISIVGGGDLTLYEVDIAASHIRKEVAADANIIVGATTEDGMNDRIRVSIVASGMSMIARQGTATAAASVPASAPPNFQHVSSSVAQQNQAVASGPLTADQGAPPVRTSQPWPRSDDANPLTASNSDDLAPGEADEFARALSEAMQEAHHNQDDPDDGDDRPTWQSSDGVTIEDGFVAPNPVRSPPPLPAAPSVTRQAAQDQFEPAPPAQVRRGAPRMPALAEFPDVAQREYFAKMEAAEQSGEHRRRAEPSQPEPGARPRATSDRHDQAGPTPLSTPHTTSIEPIAPPRAGLLRRLTGGSRK